MESKQESRPLLSSKEYEKDINPEPNYQHGSLWKQEQSLLIDSVLRLIGVPKVYLRAASFLTSAVLVALLTAGCATSPLHYLWASRNDPLRPGERTRVTLEIEAEDIVAEGNLFPGNFVGIALSGGGSRAAVFAGYVLVQLEAAGILQRATAISTVSGGSLAGAAYRLTPKGDWTPERVRKLFVRNFQAHWIGRWFLPWHFVRYWFTGFDRSDIMAQVFDDFIFDGKTFRDLYADSRLPPRPRLLINATSFVRSEWTPEREAFVFTEEEFEKLGSDLGSYPIAEAVMASGAFPGAFANVTLRDYAQGDKGGKWRYHHLFDGGAVDNLGVATLFRMAHTMFVNPTKSLKHEPGKVACTLIVVDAYTIPPKSELERRSSLPDTRELLDLFLDRNFLESASVMLAQNREKTLSGLDVLLPKVPEDPLPVLPRKEFREPDPVAHTLKESVGQCYIWPIALAHLYSSTFTKGDERSFKLAEAVNRIPTEYTLSEQEADCLQEAAETLVWRSPFRESACSRISPDRCPPKPPEPQPLCKL